MKKITRTQKRILAWFTAFLLLITSGMFDQFAGIVQIASAEEAATITLSGAKVSTCSYKSKNFDYSTAYTGGYYSTAFMSQSISNTANNPISLYLDINTAVTFDVNLNGSETTWGAYFTTSNDQNIGDISKLNSTDTSCDYSNGKAGVIAEPSKGKLTICAGSNPTKDSPIYVRVYSANAIPLRFSVNILKPAIDDQDKTAIIGSPEIVANHTKSFSMKLDGNPTDVVKWSVSNPTNGATATIGENDGLFKAGSQNGTILLTGQMDPNIPNDTSKTYIVTVAKRIARYQTITISPQVLATALSFKQSTYNVEIGKTLNLMSDIQKTPETATDAFTWTTSDKSIAEVTSDGIVTGKKSGIATITVSGDAPGVTSSCQVYVGVDKNSISLLPLSIPNCTYNGTAQTPANEYITYQNGANTSKIVNGTDYTVTYKNNTNAGTATAVINGKGNYNGSTEKNFTILPASISGSDTTIAAISDQTYSAAAIKPSLSVKWGTTGLSVEKDYTVSYSNNTNVGTATATITGKGNFTGTKSISFKILAKPVSSISFDSIPAQTFTGQNITPALKGTYNKVAVTQGKDYTTTYEKNRDTGTATIKITGTGNFKDTTTKTFSIAKASLEKDVTVDNIPDQYYCATYMQPKVVIRNKSNYTLNEGDDYKVTYKDNFSVGTATVTITGMNNFTGTVTKTFKIIMGTCNNPATKITVKNSNGYEITNDTIYVDTKATFRFPVTISNDTGNCDDIVTVGCENGEKFFGSITENVVKGQSATLAVTGLAPGVSKLYLNTMSGKLQKTINVVVYAPATSMKINYTDEKNSKVDITDNQINMIACHSLQLSVVYTPSDSTDTVSWSVSDSSVAKISENGLLTLLQPGTITVTATTKEMGTGPRGVTAKTMLTVIENKPASSISIDKHTLNLRPNQTETIAATTKPENNTEQLQWKTSDSKVATVDSAGRVTGVGKGTATITCSNFDGNIVEKCKVYVATPATAMTMNIGTKTINQGKSVTLIASLVPNTADEDIIWSSSDPSIATVKKSGDMVSGAQKAVVKGVSVGQCTITAKSVLTGKVSTCTIRVFNSAAPGTVSVKSAKAGKKLITLSWKKVAKANGYLISYSTSKTFKSAKTKTSKGSSLKLKKLTSKKTYYVRVRAYKKSGSKKIYGEWSTVKKAKVK